MLFLNTYAQFDQWLIKLGFVKAAYDVSAGYADYHWSHYSELVEPLYGVEHYQHHALKIGTRFLRDKNEHKFLFVGSRNAIFGEHSLVTELQPAKESILNMVITHRDKILLDMEALMNLSLD